MNHILSLEQQDVPAGALYMVASPIGNLGDITYRAVHILNAMDGIACEDTRHSAHLLNALGIHKPLVALHEHNEMEAAQQIARKLQQGQRWAYLCDAGTPGISDPGGRLVKIMQEHALQVIPIPGPSALTALISVGGKTLLSAQGQFQFLGFLPMKGKERKERFLLMNQSKLSSIFYEAPQRLISTLKELQAELTDQSRTLVIGRELTKKFETISHLRIDAIPQWIAANQTTKGEFCLILEGSSFEPSSHSQELLINPLLLASALAEHLGSKQIADVFAKSHIMSKNDAYEFVLQMKNPPKGGS